VLARGRLGRRLLPWAILLVCTGLAAACEETPSPSNSILGATDAAPTIPSPTMSSEALDDAKIFREAFALRADEAWIIEVWRSPDADRLTFGVPLTQEEVDELTRRASSIDQISGVVGEYGRAHPADWGGAFVDHAAGGVLVAQFKSNVAAHGAALMALVRPGAQLTVREVRWSLAELQALGSRFNLNDPWFRTLPAVLYGTGPNIMTNRLELEVSSADPRAADLILRHFNLGNDQVFVKLDGTGALLLPTGKLRVRAVDKDGRPVAGLACAAFPDAQGAYEPRPLPMPTTDKTGTCSMTLPATGYWVHLERGAGPPELVAIGRAVVVAGLTMEVTIEVN
jgi:hypothetical protein